MLVAAIAAAAMVAPVTASADTAGLVAAYGFEETSGTGVVDSSSAGNAGIVAGATRTTAGRFGRALSFDGVDDRVNVNDAASLDLTTGMTLEAWVNPTAAGGAWRTVVIKEQPAQLAYALYSAESNNRPSAHAYTNADIDARGGAAVPLNTWTHLAVTYDGAMLRLYVNGAPAAGRALTGAMVTSSSPLRIGGNAVWGEYFKGLIDEVRVYNRALTSGEIAADMAASVVPTDTPPSAPTVASPTVDGDDVALTWSASTDDIGVASYRVHRATTVGFTPSDANLLTTTTTLSHLDANLAAGTYHYKVVAVDTSGNRGAPSNEVSATLSDAPPSAPTLATPAVTADDVLVSWSAATDDRGVTGYRIHRSTTAGFTPSDANLLATQIQLSRNDLNLATGTYHYKVVAVDTAGNRSVPSNEVSATVAPDTSPPTAGEPRGGCGMTVSGDVQTEVWPRDDRGIASIELQVDGVRVRYSEMSPAFFRWDSRRQSNGPHTLTSIVRDTAGNEASWSCALTIDNPPMTVEFTSPADGSTVSGVVTVAVTPRIGGNPTLGAGIRFKVDGAYVGPTDWEPPYQFSWNTAALAEGPHELSADMWYLYPDATPYVSGSIDVVVEHPADTTPPSAPGSLAATRTGDDVALSWSASTDDVGVTRYTVHRSGTAGFTPAAANRIATQAGTGYADNDLAPGTYYYKVLAEDAAGNVSAASNEASATIAAPDPTPPGLVASYGFNETSGGSVADGSGNGNTGTISGATRTASGKNGGALSFDGTNDLVTIPDAASLDLTSGMTLEAWVNPSRLSGSWRTVLLKERPGGMVYALYAAGAGGRPGGYFVSGDEFSALAPNVPSLNTWVHLATTYDGSTLRLYINGTQVASEAQGGSMAPSTGALKIGGNNVWPEWYQGLIDDVRVYDRALTAAQIQADKDRAVGP
jgi:fibronectin type 3 domain-containing protein